MASRATKGIAEYFHALWIGFWIYLGVFTLIHTYRWDPTAPYLTDGLLALWELTSVLLGFWAGLSAWWGATLNHRPWQVLYGWQVLGWSLGLIGYMCVVVGFHVGVMMGMIFGLDATLHRYPEIPIDGFFLNASSARYVFLAAFLIVAILQTLAIGGPMARQMVTWLSDRWYRN